MPDQTDLDFTRTFGPSYDACLDRDRIMKQHERVRRLMLDGKWRTLDEVAAETGDPAASVSAQLRHLRKARFGSHQVDKRRRVGSGDGVWEYRVAEAGGESTEPTPSRPSRPEIREALNAAIDRAVASGESATALHWLRDKHG